VGSEEAEYLAATHFQVQVIKCSRFSLLEKANLIVLCQLDDFDYYFRWVTGASAHFVVLSRHFPAARRNVSRISGSDIRSACFRRGKDCSSGAVNVTSWAGAGS